MRVISWIRSGTRRVLHFDVDSVGTHHREGLTTSSLTVHEHSAIDAL